ncbi:MAG: AIR synthase-related protein, partial [Nanoarchaeota archaeon]
SETQERFTWISPKNFTKTLLKIYNEDFALSTIAENAKAAVIGKVTKSQDYKIKHKGKIICNVPIKAVTKGIQYQRDSEEPGRNFNEPVLDEPKDYNETALKILNHPNVASKEKCYKHYDRNVMGNSVIESGQADAGLLRAVPGSKYGIALSVDCNPKYGRINPYLGAVNAVAESMRNVAAIGAVPSALTDCLNYGNPEDEEQFYDFIQGVKGIKVAAENLYLKGTKYPVPVISGNVSFYNESSKGKAIDPSAIIACIGVMKNYEKTITMKLKKEGSILMLAGNRKDELGGSVYYDINGKLGKNVPEINFEEHRNMVYAIIDCIENGLFLSCHDISDGGMFTAIAEMILGGNADGKIGAEINFDYPHLRNDKILFSESPGFVFEVEEKNKDKVQSIFKKYNLFAHTLGKTTNNKKLTITNSNKKIIDLTINFMQQLYEILKGEDVNVEVRIFNLKSTNPANAQIEYLIKDFDDNVVLYEEEEVLVKGQTSFIKLFNLPPNIKSGNYVFAAKINYENSTGTSSYIFNVGERTSSKKILPICKSYNCSFYILLI